MILNSQEKNFDGFIFTITFCSVAMAIEREKNQPANWLFYSAIYPYSNIILFGNKNK